MAQPNTEITSPHSDTSHATAPHATTPQAKPPYWFPRRHYGWGWGLPTCWQGWAVFLVYGLGLWCCNLLFQHSPTLLALATLAVTAVLIGVCIRKGEPPSWTWGDS